MFIELGFLVELTVFGGADDPGAGKTSQCIGLYMVNLLHHTDYSEVMTAWSKKGAKSYLPQDAGNGRYLFPNRHTAAALLL